MSIIDCPKIDKLLTLWLALKHVTQQPEPWTVTMNQLASWQWHSRFVKWCLIAASLRAVIYLTTDQRSRAAACGFSRSITNYSAREKIATLDIFIVWTKPRWHRFKLVRKHPEIIAKVTVTLKMYVSYWSNWFRVYIYLKPAKGIN